MVLPLPNGRIYFLVFRKMLSPAGKLPPLVNVFRRVQRATKGCPIRTRLRIRTLVVWLITTCKAAVPTAFLYGPFFSGSGTLLDNDGPDLALFACYTWNDGCGVSAEDAVIFFDLPFKLQKQNTQPLEELGGVRGPLPRR